MKKLRGDRLVGRFFAASRAKLREIADRIGVRHVVNWRVVRSDDTIMNRGLDRKVATRSPQLSTEAALLMPPIS
jgi:hypothetical protein